MGLYSNYCILGKSIFCLITDPDCYKLVLKNEGSLGFEEKTKTTTSKSTLITTNSSGQEWVQSFSKTKQMLVLIPFSLFDNVSKVMFFELNSFYIFFSFDILGNLSAVFGFLLSSLSC